MKFVKYKINSKDLMPYWWEYDDSTPINNARLKNIGLGQNSGNDLTGYEIFEADSWYDLDWKGTKVYSPEYFTGWVSPDGKFYGCDYEYHLDQALFVHKTTMRDLEERGFIKITKKLRSDEYMVLNTAKITPKQFKWFKDNYVLSNREEIISRLEWNLKINTKEKILEKKQTF